MLNSSLMGSSFDPSRRTVCGDGSLFLLCLCAFVSSHCAVNVGSRDGEDACLCPRLGEKTCTVDPIKSEALCVILLFFRQGFSLKSWVPIPAPYKPGMVRQTHLSFRCSGSRGKRSATALRVAWSQQGFPGSSSYRVKTLLLNKQTKLFKANSLFPKCTSSPAAQLVEICLSCLKLRVCGLVYKATPNITALRRWRQEEQKFSLSSATEQV